MEEIILQQRNAAEPVSGRAFFLGVTLVIVKLALAQIVVNALIMLTGLGLLNIAFYIFAVVTLVGFMTRTVAGCTYTLKESTLLLQKLLGDSTISVVEIPLDAIVSVRPVVFGERLKCSYRSVTVIDAAAAMPGRMRLAFGLSLFSAGLARCVAGKTAEKPRGYAIVYMENGRRQACVFLPDESMCAALEDALPQAFGHDDRTRENTPVTMLSQALERAFPALYAHVEPLMDAERAEAAKEEIERQRQSRAAKKGKSKKKPGAGSKAQEAAQEEKQDEVQHDTV